jgi:membrane-bound serine protease (ClpP class)
MLALGLLLLLLGTFFVVAEMHAPSISLGLAGGTALAAGAVIAIAGLGGGAVLAVPVGIALASLVCAWLLAVARSASRSRGTRIQVGAEALCGRVAVVRRWSESAGQVFVDGALWRARHECLDDDEEAFREGESVMIERVSGLTLSVRRAEEWELIL